MKMSPQINDFVIRFANVNGTGSASANGLVAKTIARMGVGIGPKNMFPSNIQGLPTWYEIRVNEQGHTARKGQVDLLVAMNGQTIIKDQAELPKGAFLLYDSTKFLPAKLKRDNIHYLPLPITQLARERVKVSRQRGLLQNMLYVGALCHLLKLDANIIRGLIGEQYKTKPKLVPINIEVFEEGLAYAQNHFTSPPAFYVQAKKTEHEKIIIDGNSALALGCLVAGATVCGWYPITPSTSVVEAFENYCSRFRTTSKGEKKYAIMQAEDEISACGMVIGAMWNGARAFTATSGPGISLMNELLGFAYYSETPCVIFDIQRNGPSTGMPTRNHQADLLLGAYASHGDTNHIMLFPCDPHECYEFAILSFDYAERFQTPVLVMSELEIGMNDYQSPILELPENFQPDRGKVLRAEDLEQRTNPFYRYLDEDEDGVCYRTYPGEHPKGSFFTRGSGHDELGRYTENPASYQKNLDRIRKKFATASYHLPEPVFVRKHQNAEHAILYFGSTHEAAQEACETLAKEGWVFDQIRLRSYPFSPVFLDKLCQYQSIIICEQNQDGQLKKLLLQTSLFAPDKLHSALYYDGMPLTAHAVFSDLNQHLQTVNPRGV